MYRRMAMRSSNRRDSPGVSYARVWGYVAPFELDAPPFSDCGSSLRFAQIALFLLFSASKLASFRPILGSF